VWDATVNDNFFGKFCLGIGNHQNISRLIHILLNLCCCYYRNGQRSGKSHHGKQRTPCYQVRFNATESFGTIKLTTLSFYHRNALNIVKDDLIVKVDELTRYWSHFKIILPVLIFIILASKKFCEKRFDHYKRSKKNSNAEYLSWRMRLKWSKKKQKRQLKRTSLMMRYDIIF